MLRAENALDDHIVHTELATILEVFRDIDPNSIRHDCVLEVFLVDDVTGENFNEAAAIEFSTGIDVIGAYEVSEYVVLPLQEETRT